MAAARRSNSPAIEPGYNLGRRPANAGKRYPAETLTRKEVHALIAACSNRAPTGVRNRALIVLLYRGGLRISEAIGHSQKRYPPLYPKDIDRAAGTVTVLHGKGDKRRTIGLDPEAFAVVERWLEKRQKLGISARAPLFCTLDGGRLDSSYVRRLLPRLAARAGIDKRVHAHGLRHSMAAEMAQENVPINLIQDALGHSSLATTDRYLRHVHPQQLIAAMRARTWED
jgi:integrase/recombinase XerD